jgi:putative transcriptional regulator
MKAELFDELLGSVREGGAIVRGKGRAGRRTKIEEPDVVAIREAYGLSQERFAALLGISVRTLQNWEQGRGGRTVQLVFFCGWPPSIPALSWT